jgi:hypothetical protein
MVYAVAPRISRALKNSFSAVQKLISECLKFRFFSSSRDFSAKSSALSTSD